MAQHEQAPYQMVLEPYVNRLQVRPGNGLSKSMNQSLRSYPDIPVIIERVVKWLYEAEVLASFGGVYVQPRALYRDLTNQHRDWNHERLIFKKPLVTALDVIVDLTFDPHHETEGIAMAQILEFERIPTLPYQRFYAAMTIARKIQLLAGHGRIGFSMEVSKMLRAISLSQRFKRRSG